MSGRRPSLVVGEATHPVGERRRPPADDPGLPRRGTQSRHATGGGRVERPHLLGLLARHRQDEVGRSEVGDGDEPAAVLVDVDTELAGDAAEPAVGLHALAGRRARPTRPRRRCPLRPGRGGAGPRPAASGRGCRCTPRGCAGASLKGGPGRSGRAGTPTTVSPGATSRTTDAPAPTVAHAPMHRPGSDAGADADERALTDGDVAGDGDPGRDVGEGADPAAVVDGGVRVDDDAAFEVGDGIDDRTGHHEHAVVDVVPSAETTAAGLTARTNDPPAATTASDSRCRSGCRRRRRTRGGTPRPRALARSPSVPSTSTPTRSRSADCRAVTREAPGDVVAARPQDLDRHQGVAAAPDDEHPGLHGGDRSAVVREPRTPGDVPYARTAASGVCHRRVDERGAAASAGPH